MQDKGLYSHDAATSPRQITNKIEAKLVEFDQAPHIFDSQLIYRLWLDSSVNPRMRDSLLAGAAKV